jgi:hypothetical protein
MAWWWNLLGIQIVAFKCGYLQTTYSHNQPKGAKGGCEYQHYNLHQITPKQMDIIVIIWSHLFIIDMWTKPQDRVG